MLSAVRASWALLAGMFMVMVGNGLQGTLLGVRGAMESFSGAEIGIIMAGFWAGYLIGSQVCSQMVKTVGHIRVFAAAASIISSVVLAHGLLPDPILWTVLRFLNGFGLAAVYVVAESWLNTSTDNRNRGGLWSVYTVVVLFGMASGQLSLNLSDPGTLDLFILVSVVTSMSLVPMALAPVAQPTLPETKPFGVKAVYRSSPLGFMGTLLSGVSTSALLSMAPVYATRVGLDVAGVSFFMTAAIVGAAFVQWPIGRASDRFDRRTVLMICAAAAAGVALLFAIRPSGNIWVLYGMIAFYSGLAIPLYSLSVTHLNDFLEPEQMVSASATMALIYGLGSIFGPLIVGEVIDLYGPGGMFWAQFAGHAGLAIFAFYRMLRRDARPLEEQGAYVIQGVAAASVEAQVVAAELAVAQQEDEEAA